MSVVWAGYKIGGIGKDGRRGLNSGIKPISRFARDNRGNVAMTFGLMIFMMVGFIGASVDIGRWMLARKQTQEAEGAHELIVDHFEDLPDSRAIFLDVKRMLMDASVRLDFILIVLNIMMRPLGGIDAILGNVVHEFVHANILLG